MTEGADQRYPLARTDDLLVEQVDSETVIYDGREKQAHCLSPLAAAVFELSDGRRSLDELTAAATARLGEAVDESQVEQALAELEQRDLMVAGASAGISRRNMIRKTAVVGTAVVASSFVTTLGSTAMAQTAGSCTGGCANGTPGQTACQARGGTTCNCVGPNNAKMCTTATGASLPNTGLGPP